MKSLIGLVSAGIALLAGVPAAAEDVRDQGLRFSISFPGQSHREVLPGEGQVTNAVVYDLHLEGAYFTVSAAQFGSASQTFNDLDSALELARSECVVGDEVLEQRAIPVDGGRGGEALTRSEPSFGLDPANMHLIRYVVRGNKLYCVRATYDEGGSPAAARRFVQSFATF